MNSHSKEHDGDGHAKNSKDSVSTSKRKRTNDLNMEAPEVTSLKQELNNESEHEAQSAKETGGTRKVDFNSVHPPPKEFDQPPSDLLQPPEESACPQVKGVFKVFMADMKNLQKLANAEDYNQHIFATELSNRLYVWEKYLAPYFTEGAKKMVMKLSAWKKELDSKRNIQEGEKKIEELKKQIQELKQQIQEEEKKVAAEKTSLSNLSHLR